MNNLRTKQRTVIVGAGPAGTSLAIRLARGGRRVTLVERESFPRHKLCGEFVSPECLDHFRDLGVFDEMIGAGGGRIVKTVFYAPSGKSVTVLSDWLGESGGALGISRSAMDLILLEQARRSGAEVLTETQIVDLKLGGGDVRAITAKTSGGDRIEIEGDLFIDATGRARQLGKLAERRAGDAQPKRAAMIGFKAHLSNVRLEPGVCEIYFFDGGYGGLSYVENGAANHCFLVSADRYKSTGGIDRLLETVVYRNVRAREAMKDSVPVFEWLAVPIESFGRNELQIAPNLFAVGDSAAFIDPFTGSGMLLALESSAEFAAALAENDGDSLAEIYRRRYSRRFDRRLKICGLLRRAAFWPRATAAAIGILGIGPGPLRWLARSTRALSDMSETS